MIADDLLPAPPPQFLDSAPIPFQNQGQFRCASTGQVTQWSLTSSELSLCRFDGNLRTEFRDTIPFPDLISIESQPDSLLISYWTDRVHSAPGILALPGTTFTADEQHQIHALLQKQLQNSTEFLVVRPRDRSLRHGASSKIGTSPGGTESFGLKQVVTWAIGSKSIAVCVENDDIITQLKIPFGHVSHMSLTTADHQGEPSLCLESVRAVDGSFIRESLTLPDFHARCFEEVSLHWRQALQLGSIETAFGDDDSPEYRLQKMVLEIHQRNSPLPSPIVQRAAPIQMPIYHIRSVHGRATRVTSTVTGPLLQADPRWSGEATEPTKEQGEVSPCIAGGAMATTMRGGDVHNNDNDHHDRDENVTQNDHNMHTDMHNDSHGDNHSGNHSDNQNDNQNDSSISDNNNNNNSASDRDSLYSAVSDALWCESSLTESSCQTDGVVMASFPVRYRSASMDDVVVCEGVLSLERTRARCMTTVHEPPAFLQQVSFRHRQRRHRRKHHHDISQDITALDVAAIEPQIQTCIQPHDQPCIRPNTNEANANAAANRTPLFYQAMHPWEEDDVVEGDLAFRQSELLKVVRKESNGWWYAVRVQKDPRNVARWLDKEEGWVPSNFLQPCSASV